MKPLLAVVIVVLALHAATWRFFLRLPSSASQQDRLTVTGAFHVGLFQVLTGIGMAPVGGLVTMLGVGAFVLGIYMTRQGVKQGRVLRAAVQAGVGTDAKQPS